MFFKRNKNEKGTNGGGQGDSAPAAAEQPADDRRTQDDRRTATERPMPPLRCATPGASRNER